MTHHHDDHDHHDHHHHQHDHEHHSHSHDHHHHGHHNLESPMTDKEKLLKLMDHWVAHNNDHAENYVQWSRKAEDAGLAQVAQLLRDAAELTHGISEKFRQAKENIK